ncbi:chromosomal replication initiator protein DnaA [Facklamia sp. DSM 111018]|uniref:Chromosomal replication initiator protein DnaA n=1 Tax=Facklamia lactis TaxID=2749967 RepID=A0ABS0LT72_9LACT|nr:chromosomal replication initiator protein DnaA [Facklamia lactis]MBG9981305.1 chromosomal replication initiator protein DnaA [Facklamia lactis]MBG9987219.1 chromosomal replication initiator protein DnaA [Facklamia lactis]
MDEKDLFWQGALSYFKDILSASSYHSWVEPAKPTRIGNQSITIAVPNPMTKKYWENHLANYMLQYSRDHYGMEYEPIFVIYQDEEFNSSTLTKNINEEPDLELPEFSDSKLNPSYTFENFVIGEDNKMAAGAALAVSDGPGKTYNPFLIYGGVGLGKTHLMQAIGNEIYRKDPSIKIKYATSESFVNDFITSIQNGSQKQFREMYREIDVLLIDDIQFLSKKDATQEEFFHTFNELYNNNKQIVLTSDRLPNNIDNLEERLISRFKWGLSTDITPPDLETRIAILRKKAANDRLDIDSETLTYIASNIDSNIRELEGALMRVIAFAAIEGKEITSNLASEALSSIFGNNTERIITADNIIETASQFYSVSIDEIKGKKRNKEIVHARQVAMYLTRELTELSFPKIGEAFGNKNHTTVIHAYEKISDEKNENSALNHDLQILKKSLNR